MREWKTVDTWNPQDDLMTGNYEVQTRVKDSFLNRNNAWNTVCFNTLRERIATLSDIRVYSNQEYRIRKIENIPLNLGKFNRIERKDNGDYEIFFSNTTKKTHEELAEEYTIEKTNKLNTNYDFGIPTIYHHTYYAFIAGRKSMEEKL